MSTYTPIASQTLSSAVTSVTFSSIPQNYTDLVLVMSVTNTSSTVYRALQFNTDTSTASTNYSTTTLFGDGTNAGSDRQSNTYGIAGFLATSSGLNSNIYIANIMNYSSSSVYKTVIARSNNLAEPRTSALTGLWRSMEAINSITMITANSNTYGIGTTFSLYGIVGGGVTAKASGGVVTTDATYAYHTFLSSGAFTPYQALTVDYLVVAGGGSGARTGGGHGAGGAGGLRSTVTQTGGNAVGVNLETPLSLTSGVTYPVIIGAGAAQPSGDGQGNNGSNSVFFTILSNGGGGGGNSVATGLLGGSGGGGSRSGNAGGAGTTNQGYAGGSAGPETNAYGGGGGGGAGAVGANGTGSGGGNGGTGVAVSITGSSVTYAGGGGGGTNASGFAAGTGGAGGGGNGSNGNAVAATSGSANTGGGGGGGSNGLANNGNGGSGIVVIRYAL